MTNEGGGGGGVEKNVPHLCKHSKHLSVYGQYRKDAQMLKHSMAYTPCQLFPGGFTGVWWSYETAFQLISNGQSPLAIDIANLIPLKRYSSACCSCIRCGLPFFSISSSG